MINSNYHLAYKDKEYYTPINRKYISKSLDNLIDDSEKKKIVEYLYDNREIIYRKNLLILPNE